MSILLSKIQRSFYNIYINQSESMRLLPQIAFEIVKIAFCFLDGDIPDDLAAILRYASKMRPIVFECVKAVARDH